MNRNGDSDEREEGENDDCRWSRARLGGPDEASVYFVYLKKAEKIVQESLRNSSALAESVAQWTAHSMLGNYK